jgi:hypothetical protein
MRTHEEARNLKQNYRFDKMINIQIFWGFFFLKRVLINSISLCSESESLF